MFYSDCCNAPIYEEIGKNENCGRCSKCQEFSTIYEADAIEDDNEDFYINF